MWSKVWREAIWKCVRMGTLVWSKTRNMRHKLVDSSSFSAHTYLLLAVPVLAHFWPLSLLLEYSRHELRLVAQGVQKVSGFQLCHDVDEGEKALMVWCFSSQLVLKMR